MSLEEDLKKKAMIQHIQDQQQQKKEELLKQREQAIAQREIDLMHRELIIAITQNSTPKPTPKKRKNAKLKKKDASQIISSPSGKHMKMCTFLFSFFVVVVHVVYPQAHM